MGILEEHYKNCRGIAQPLTKEDCHKLHTKQLLNMRRAYAWTGLDKYWCDGCPKAEQCKAVLSESAACIYAELTTRPHIPNKKESKANRKAKIAQGK